MAVKRNRAMFLSEINLAQDSHRNMDIKLTKYSNNVSAKSAYCDHGGSGAVSEDPFIIAKI